MTDSVEHYSETKIQQLIELTVEVLNTQTIE